MVNLVLKNINILYLFIIYKYIYIYIDFIKNCNLKFIIFNKIIRLTKITLYNLILY
jgi:hypothetical protein